MPKRKRRGRPKGLSGQNMVKESVDSGLERLDSPLDVAEVDRDFADVQEADVGMPDKWVSRVQTRRESVHGNLNSHNSPSNMVEGSPGWEESEEADLGMPNKWGRGRPKGLRFQNSQESVPGILNSHAIPSTTVEVGPMSEELEAVIHKYFNIDTVVSKQKVQGQPSGSRGQNRQESADGNFHIHIKPSNMRDVSFGSEEEQETVMSRKKVKGQPSGSRGNNRQVSADGNLDIRVNPANMREVSSGSEEEQQADTVMSNQKVQGQPSGSRGKNRQVSADGNSDIRVNPSNMREVSSGNEEKQQADTVMSKQKVQGQPSGSRGQNRQDSAEGNLDIRINPSNATEVSSASEEEQEADTVMSKQKVQGQPSGSRGQNCQESADGNLDICINPLNVREVSSGSEEEQGTDITPMKRGPGRPIGSTANKNHQQSAGLSLYSKKKGRGPTRGLLLEMKRQQSADGKLDVIIHPTRLVAVGPGRKDFITDLSLIVRKHARLNVNKWRQVSKDTRDKIVQSVLKNWRLLDTDTVRKAILDEAGRLYRNWRNKLHDYYLLFDTKEEALKHVPDDINPADWPIMVDYFTSPSFERMSTVNKVNRTKMRTLHTCGQKSYQAVSYDARELVTGKEPDLQTLWHLTHKKANGQWVDEASKEIHDKVAEQIDEKLRQIDDSQEAIETIEPEIINSAFKEVVGKKSYMQGPGPVLRFSNSATVQQLQAELEAQKKEAENARKDCDEIRARLVEVESQLDQERRKREDVEARLLDRQKDMQDINSQVQAAIQSALLQYRPPGTAEETSSKTKTLVAELEAQLNEAEDVITDLRAELRKRNKRN